MDLGSGMWVCCFVFCFVLFCFFGGGGELADTRNQTLVFYEYNRYLYVLCNYCPLFFDFIIYFQTVGTGILVIDSVIIITSNKFCRNTYMTSERSHRARI